MLTWEKCLAQSATKETRESCLLITALINSDGHKAADAEEKAHATAGWLGDFPPTPFQFLKKGQHKQVVQCNKIFSQL